MQEWAVYQHKKQIEDFQDKHKGRKHLKKTLLANDIWKNSFYYWMDKFQNH